MVALVLVTLTVTWSARVALLDDQGAGIEGDGERGHHNGRHKGGQIEESILEHLLLRGHGMRLRAALEKVWPLGRAAL